ncbi:MAG: hypothetical protein HRT77_13925 [Halioglobus sp.]|nr:hypothetical protein [Halioglobus sp.]
MRHLICAVLSFAIAAAVSVAASAGTPALAPMPFSVPFKVGEDYRASDLNLIVKGEELRLPIAGYLKSSTSSEDVAFRALLSLTDSADTAAFESLLKPKDRGTKDAELYFYLFTRHQTPNANLGKGILLVKIYQESQISFLIRASVNGKERGYLFRFVKSGGRYFLAVDQPRPVVSSLISRAMRFNEEHVGKFFTVLDDLPGDGNYMGSGEYPVIVTSNGFTAIEKPLGEVGDIIKPDSPDSLRSLSVFSGIQDALEKNDVRRAFTFMGPDAPNRFEDINAQNEGSVAQTLLNLAVPQLVIGVLDASPFYIAYGTNMIQKYAQFRNENDLIKKSALFEKMNVTPRIVWKDTAGVFRQIGILRSNPTSTLLESPEFIHSVVFPSLLDK